MEFTYTEAKELIREIGRFEEAQYNHYGLTILDAEQGEYAIGTEDQAEEAWEQALDSYIEECIEPELPGSLMNYFDEEKWKSDARFDGRGHALSSYDGCETNVEGLVMFRIN